MSYVRVDPDLRKLEKAVKAAVRAGADLRPVWREFRRPLRKIQGEHIKAQKGPDGEQWAKLRPSTIRARMARGGKAKKFTKRGKLRKGAKRKLGKILSRKLVSRARMKVTRRSISLYARGGLLPHLHQGGGRVGRRRVRMWGRPFMYVDSKLARDAFKRVSEHVAEAFEQGKEKR